MGADSDWFQSASVAAELRAPLTLPGGEVAGAEVVRELPAAFALPVWQALRCVLRWAAAEPGARAALFDAEAMVAWEVELLEAGWDEGARLPAAVIAGALADPGRADAERLARACLCLCDWSLARGAVPTGLAFAEAAALAWPEQPRYAYAAGRLLRAHGRPREAEAWMRRVVRVGRMLGDWSVQALGLNSLGNTFIQVGDFRQAVRVLRKALRVARIRHLERLEGEILHDLFIASWSAGYAEVAEGYARAAFERYRGGHERLPALAHDVAFSWVKQGHYDQALSVLVELPVYFTVPHERARLMGSIARAAGACGNRGLFDRAAGEIREIASIPNLPREIASPLVELAVGATSLALWDTAESALELAVQLASQRGEGDVLARAEEARDQVRQRKALSASTVSFERVPVPMVDLLAEDLRNSLHTGEMAGAL